MELSISEDTSQKQAWLRHAEMLKPRLVHWECPAVWQGALSNEKSAWQGVAFQRQQKLQTFLADNSFSKNTQFIVEFPETIVGRLHFRVYSENGYGDSPVKLRLVFAELPAELMYCDKPYTGILSGTWLQDEIIHTDDFPQDVVLPRRYSCRYIQFQILGCPGKINFSDIGITAEAMDSQLPACCGLKGLDSEIDAICLRTIRNCMQLCPEDGVKRDRRLWLGDLRIANFLNHVTYKRYDVIERALWLFAGCADGRQIDGCLFDRPIPHKGCEMVDYSLLFAVVLEEYCRFTGRYHEVGEELFQIASEQFILGQQYFRNDLLQLPDDSWNFFIDHEQRLHKEAAFQGLALFSLNALLRLGKAIGKSDGELRQWRELRERWLEAGRNAFYDVETGLLVCKGQVSIASQVWGILGGLLTPEEGKRALTNLEGRPDILMPRTPYLVFTWLEAMEMCGEKDNVLPFIRQYWGSMLKNGADTCWEVYTESEPFFSPYKDFRLNSACHIWSAGALWFLRK